MDKMCGRVRLSAPTPGPTIFLVAFTLFSTAASSSSPAPHEGGGQCSEGSSCANAASLMQQTHRAWRRKDGPGDWAASDEKYLPIPSSKNELSTEDRDLIYDDSNPLDKYERDRPTPNETETSRDVSEENATKKEGASEESRTVENAKGKAKASNATCVTRESPLAVSHGGGSATARAGTPCLFGVDPRDEGRHCILEGKDMGPNGWCWADKSRSKWGSCDDGCPLFGPSRVLEKKLEKVQSKLGKAAEAIDAFNLEKEGSDGRPDGRTGSDSSKDSSGDKEAPQDEEGVVDKKEAEEYDQARKGKEARGSAKETAKDKNAKLDRHEDANEDPVKDAKDKKATKSDESAGEDKKTRADSNKDADNASLADAKDKKVAEANEKTGSDTALMLGQDPNLSSNGTNADEVFNASSDGDGDGVNVSDGAYDDDISTNGSVDGASGNLSISNISASDAAERGTASSSDDGGADSLANGTAEREDSEGSNKEAEEKISNGDVEDKADKTERKRPITATCFIVKDPLQGSWGYAPAEPGTPCLFGQDPRDEGSHCILDEGRFGSNGWCYTSDGLESWGSCCAACPLYGPAGQLEKQVAGVSARVRKLADIVTAALNISALPGVVGANVSVVSPGVLAGAISGAAARLDDGEAVGKKDALADSIVRLDDGEAAGENVFEADGSGANDIGGAGLVDDAVADAESVDDEVEDADAVADVEQDAKAVDDKAEEAADQVAAALIKSADDEAVVAFAAKEEGEQKRKDRSHTQGKRARRRSWGDRKKGAGGPRGEAQMGQNWIGAAPGADSTHSHRLGREDRGKHRRVAKRIGGGVDAESV